MSGSSGKLTDAERDVRRSLVEGAEKSEADRDRLLATSWLAAIASMYAFANGVSGEGPWLPGMSTMLSLAWIFMGLSALIVTISHDVSARVHRHAVSQFDDGERDSKPGGASRAQLEMLNRLVWIPFGLGWLVALAFFWRFGG